VIKVPTDDRGVKRITFRIVAAILVIFVVATPALAQKDPFRPLVSEGETAPQGTTGEEPSASPAAPAATEPTTDGSGLARTGAEASDWVPLALILVLVGAAVLVLDRYRRVA
jgi:hypothetical protein